MLGWRKYNGALIPNGPPHLDANVERIGEMIVKENVYFARWTTQFDCKEETKFWFVICDKFTPIEMLSRNTRNNTRRGLKRCTVKQVNCQFIIDNCYSVYRAAFDSYDGHLTPLSAKDFTQEHLSYTDSEVWNFWVVYENEKNQIIGYTRNKVEYNQCELCTTKFHPDFLRKYYPSEALFYTLNDYYLNQKKYMYINDGARSISHETNIQSFLIQKYRFRKAYCKLNIVYRKPIHSLVNILFPLRFLFRFINFGLIIKLNILLHQEEIRRSYA